MIALPEETKVVDIFQIRTEKTVRVPFYDSQIPAGFPSPADDCEVELLDLNSYMIEHPVSTYLVRVSGDSMINRGIFDGDILVVDRSLAPVSGKIVIAVVNGEFTVKEFWREGKRVELRPANPRFRAIKFEKGSELTIWGVVTGSVRKF